MTGQLYLKIVALILVVLASAEIGLCTEWSPRACRYNQEAGTDTEHRPHSEDSCLCCCPHLLIGYSPSLVVMGATDPAEVTIFTGLPSVANRLVYHPPQA